MTSTLNRSSGRGRPRLRLVSERGRADVGRWREQDGFAAGYADPDDCSPNRHHHPDHHHPDHRRRSDRQRGSDRSGYRDGFTGWDGDGFTGWDGGWDEYAEDRAGYGSGPGRSGGGWSGASGTAPRVRRPSQARGEGQRARAPRVRSRRPPPRARVTRPPMRLGSSRRRLRFAVVLLCALLLVLAGRLTQLQAFQASAYAERAEKQLRKEVVLAAARGVITDRSGATLARDVEARAVYADPRKISNAGGVANKLAPIIGVPAGILAPKLDGDVSFVYLARGLDPAVGKAVTDLKLPGIGVLEERRRLYPSGSLASNVLGFTTFGANDTLVGGGGIESAYDRQLRGTDGRSILEVDPYGRPIPSAVNRTSEPVPGSDIRLTIDRDIQWAAQQAIADAVRSTQADGGMVVVMAPGTGDILAMADAPDYDPNKVGSADPATLKNRATADSYEPGSVNKVITMAAAIDRGLITAATPVTVPPSLRIAGRTFRDAEPHGVEHLTAAGVLARSSNLGTIQIAQRLGEANLESALRAFGLGSRTALRFPGESAGLLAASTDWDDQQAATISYGQGMSATAIQMASVYATVANGGVRVAPRLVESTTTPDGTVQTTPRQPGTRVVGESTARTVTEMLEAVATDEGTAPLARIQGYRVAGKTGTAQRVVSGRYEGYVASFVGFAPADKPAVVVEVVLDNPRTSHYGGTVAAPVFQKVMSFALATLGVPPSRTAAPQLLLDLDAGR